MNRTSLRTVLALVVGVALCFIPISESSSKTLWLAWDPNPPGENVIGYKVYEGAKSRFDASFAGYESERDVGNVTACLLDVSDGETRYAAVVAYNKDAVRSGYSEEVAISPSGPGVSAGGTSAEASSSGGGGAGGGCFVETLTTGYL